MPERYVWSTTLTSRRGWSFLLGMTSFVGPSDFTGV
jgi:hypothetical protein